MKLLFDANLSPKLAYRLADLFPRTTHVFLAGLARATSDELVWAYARDNGPGSKVPRLPLLRGRGHEIGNRLAVPANGNALAAFSTLNQLGERILRFGNTYFHAFDCSHPIAIIAPIRFLRVRAQSDPDAAFRQKFEAIPPAAVPGDS